MVAVARSDSVRVRPVFRRLAVWVLPVVLLIAAWHTRDGVESGRFEAAWNRLFPGERVGAQPSPRQAVDNDAAPHYVAANVAAVTLSFGPIHPGTFNEDGSIAMSMIDVRRRHREAVAAGMDLDAATVGRVAQLLLAWELPLRLFHDASGREYGSYRFPIVQRAHSVSGFVTTHQVAATETLEFIRRGETAGAVRSLVARIRALRAYDEDPIVFGQAYKSIETGAIAQDTGILLAHTAPSNEELRALDAALSGVHRDDEFVTLVRSMARQEIGGLQSYASGRNQLSASGWPLPLLIRPLAWRRGVSMARTAEAALAAAERPWPQRLEAMDRLADDSTLPGISVLPLSVRFWLEQRPAALFKQVTRATASSVAAVRSTRAAIAIERSRRAGGGVPDRLDDVAPPADDRDAFIDPFTGDGLRYQRTGDSYVVYSVGTDREDQNGRLEADLTAPRRMSGARDIGVRVRYAAR